MSINERPKAVVERPDAIDIEFYYSFPEVSVETSARFKDHEVLGGKTVRQYLGTDPVNLTVTGSCLGREADMIDELTNGEEIRFISHRKSVRGLVSSTSTNPESSLNDKEDEWVHTYRLQISATNITSSTHQDSQTDETLQDKKEKLIDPAQSTGF